MTMIDKETGEQVAECSKVIEAVDESAQGVKVKNVRIKATTDDTGNVDVNKEQRFMCRNEDDNSTERMNSNETVDWTIKKRES